MVGRLCSLGLLGFVLASTNRLFAASDAVCPFLNAATAAGFLQAKDVKVAVVPSNRSKDDAVCDFTPSPSELPHVLHIEVNTMLHPKQDFPPFLQNCGGHAEPIRGIGNEAVACGGTSKEAGIYDEILSRVRERSLLIRIATKDRRADPAGLREESMQVADEVSGNLF